MIRYNRICEKSISRHCQHYKSLFLVTAKIGSPNKQNSMIFRTEIGLKVIFGANCSTCIEIVQYLRPKTKQYCHTKTLIGFVLLCTRLTVYGSQKKKKKSFGGF